MNENDDAGGRAGSRVIVPLLIWPDTTSEVMTKMAAKDVLVLAPLLFQAAEVERQQYGGPLVHMQIVSRRWADTGPLSPQLGAWAAASIRCMRTGQAGNALLLSHPMLAAWAKHFPTAHPKLLQRLMQPDARVPVDPLTGALATSENTETRSEANRSLWRRSLHLLLRRPN